MRSLSARIPAYAGGTFLHEGIDCIEQNPVIGIPDIRVDMAQAL